MMKKIILSLVTVCLMSFTSQAQVGPQLGGHIGVPVGDASDYTSFNLGLDASYLWSVADNFYAGLSTGYTTFIGEDEEILGETIERDNISFIPLAVTGNFIVGDNVLIGTDLGYAIGLEDGNDGGFYYQPKLGYSFNENTNLYLGYKGVSDDGSIDAVTLGVRFGLRRY